MVLDNLPDLKKLNFPDLKKLNLPDLKKLKFSRVVLISGLLTFLYLVEFCIGIRTVYYAFSLWNVDSNVSPKTYKVNWPICVACLLVCVSSSFAINIMSALWEQKQMKEDGKEKKVTRFALHIMVGGMVWRYACLWFSDNKKSQMRESMLLTMAKFLFTQFFTIPMIIVHASLIESLDEVIFIVCSVACISVNLILTCSIFYLCECQVIELKKWNYETVDLLPLIFSQTPGEQNTPKETEENLEKEKENEQNLDSESKTETVESILTRTLVLFQTFGFTFGRLLALGILLKLAGIYAVSIMFLQLLISVVYLKFQVPFLVSDSLPKWRQLVRLAFMSYILIFEWHLNRDPRTGHDCTSNLKHSLIYYSIATMESVFYFIAWAVADSYTTDEVFDSITKPGYKLLKSIIIVGTISLVFSLIVYFFLAFRESRKLSSLVHSIRRHYLSSKLRIRNSILSKGKENKPELNSKPSKMDISSPINNTICIPDSENSECNPNEENPNSKIYSSYQDLKEPLDEEIEIYVGRRGSGCEFKKISHVKSEVIEQKSTRNEECHVISSSENSITFKLSEEKQSAENNPCNEVESEIGHQEVVMSESVVSMTCNDKNSFESKDYKSNDLKEKDTNIKRVDFTSQSNAIPSLDNSLPKSKITILSESFGEGWNKFSALSKRFTGNVKEQFQKRKEQFQDLHGDSTTNNNKIDTGQTQSHNSSVKSSTSTSSGQNMTESFSDISEENEEGFFVGDVRCCDQDVYGSVPELNCDDTETEEKASQESTSAVDLHSEIKEPDSIHCIGDEPCPCFVCKPDEEGRFLRRRRSSSVPPADRKSWLESELLSNEKNAFSTPSSPTSVRVDLRSSIKCEKEVTDENSTVPPLIFQSLTFPSMSLLPPEERIEHYV